MTAVSPRTGRQDEQVIAAGLCRAAALTAEPGCAVAWKLRLAAREATLRGLRIVTAIDPLTFEQQADVLFPIRCFSAASQHPEAASCGQRRRRDDRQLGGFQFLRCARQRELGDEGGHCEAHPRQ